MTTMQRALARLMSEISEDRYCAGWLSGLEYELWQIVIDGQGRFGFGALSEMDVKDLRELSDACGGWIVYDAEQQETFVPLDQWLTIFAAHTNSRRA
jgi:predicted hydrolase (HD superfamily)